MSKDSGQAGAAGISVLALPGSLRAQSYNRLVLQALPALAPAGMSFEVFDAVGDLPLYNEDLDHDDPPAPVAALRAAVDRADALFWAMPEFNHTIPSVTKNVIEWISHPLSTAALVGKVSAVATATQGRGGFRGMADLTRVLRDLGGHVVAVPEVCIHFVHTCLSLDDTGAVTIADPRVARQLAQLLAALERAVHKGAGEHTEAPWRALFGQVAGGS